MTQPLLVNMGGYDGSNTPPSQQPPLLELRLTDMLDALSACELWTLSFIRSLLTDLWTLLHTDSATTYTEQSLTDLTLDLIFDRPELHARFHAHLRSFVTMVGYTHTPDLATFKHSLRSALADANTLSFLNVHSKPLASPSLSTSLHAPSTLGTSTTHNRWGCRNIPQETAEYNMTEQQLHAVAHPGDAYPQAYRLIRSVEHLPRRKRLLAEIMALMFRPINGPLPASLAANRFDNDELPLADVTQFVTDAVDLLSASWTSFVSKYHAVAITFRLSALPGESLRSLSARGRFWFEYQQWLRPRIPDEQFFLITLLYRHPQLCTETNQGLLSQSCSNKILSFDDLDSRITSSSEHSQNVAVTTIDAFHDLVPHEPLLMVNALAYKRQRTDMAPDTQASARSWNPQHTSYQKVVTPLCKRCNQDHPASHLCPVELRQIHGCSLCAGSHDTSKHFSPITYPCSRCGELHFERACPYNGDVRLILKSKITPQGLIPITEENYPTTVKWNPFKVLRRPEQPTTPPLRLSSLQHTLVNQPMGSLNTLNVHVAAATLPVPSFLTKSHPQFDGTVVPDQPPHPEYVTLLPDNPSQNPRQQAVLFDTGADPNVITENLLLDLYKTGLVRSQDIFPLPQPVTVIAATTAAMPIQYLAVINTRVNTKTYRLPYLVVPVCSFDLIIGKQGLRLLFNFTGFTGPPALFTGPPTHMHLSALKVTSQDVLIREITTNPGSEALQIEFPLLANSLICPSREPPRRYSLTENAIIGEVLSANVTSGRIEPIAPQEAICTVPVCLVDKQKSANTPRTFPDPNIPKRYRLTLDCRGLNNLKLICPGPDQPAYLLASTIQIASTAPAIDAMQFQATGQHLIARLHALECQFYGKLDLRDAFGSIRLDPRLTRLFAFEHTSGTTTQFYRWRTLPQGWRWSPLFFQVAMAYILHLTRQRLPADSKTQFVAMQDDILVAGLTATDVDTTLTILTSILTRFGFDINTDKSIFATPCITFCGFQLDRMFCRPSATRTQITRAFADAQWERFQQLPPCKRAPWLMKMAGHFNFIRHSLTVDQLPALQAFYQSLKDPTSLDVVDLKEAMYDLVDYVSNGLPFAITGRFNQVFASLIIVDANIPSWSAVLFYLIELPAQSFVTESDFPDLRHFRDSLLAAKGFPPLNLPDHVILVPIRMANDRFPSRSTSTSSTTLERWAQLEAVHLFRPLLTGTVVLISDNANCQKQWRDIDEKLQGRRFDLFMSMQAHVHYHAWLPRTGLPSLADELARTTELMRSPAIDHLLSSPSVAVPYELTTKETTKRNTQEMEKRELNTTKRKEYNKNTNPIALDNHLALDSPPLLIPLTALTADLTFCPARPSFADSLPDAYQSDLTTYHNVAMADIYRCLLNPGGNHTPQVRALTRNFHLTDNLIMYIAGSQPRFYIPDFETSDILPDLGPTNGRSSLILRAHASTGGHYGADRTLAGLVDSVWWPHLMRDIRHYIDRCAACQALRTQRLARHGLLSSTSASAAHPFDMWQLDFTEHVNQHILVAICSFSHFVVARLVPGPTAESVVRFVLDELIIPYGIPLRIHTDLGAAFTAQVTSQLTQALHINLTFSSSGLHRANGLVERVHQELKVHMTVMQTTHYPQMQDTTLPLHLAVAAHNHNAPTRNGFSPFEITHGFAPRNYSQLLLPSPASTADPLQTRRHLLHKLTRFYRTEAATHAINQYNLVSRPSSISSGQLVLYLKDYAAPGKTPFEVSGPHFVLRRVGTNTWDITKDPWDSSTFPPDNIPYISISELFLRLYHPESFVPPPLLTHFPHPGIRVLPASGRHGGPVIRITGGGEGGGDGATQRRSP
jgi:transposase InsO family protein